MGDRMTDDHVREYLDNLPSTDEADAEREMIRELVAEALARGAALAAEKEAREKAEASAAASKEGRTAADRACEEWHFRWLEMQGERDEKARRCGDLRARAEKAEAERDAFAAQVREQGQKLALAGIEGSPPPWPTTIERLTAERDALKAQVASATDLAVQAEAEVARARRERDEALVKLSASESGAAAMRLAIEPAFDEYLGNGDEPTSLEVAFKVFSDNDAGRAFLAEREAMRDACQAALDCIPCLEVHNWPPGWRLKDEALAKLKAALAAGGKEGE